MGDERECLWCGTELVQRDTESNTAYEKRLYCGKPHAATHAASKRKGRSIK